MANTRTRATGNTKSRPTPAAGAPRKRAQHLGPERRRPELLDAALSLFLERGYDGTQMQAIADRAGVTKPVVYAGFASKETLFRALLEREEERILAEIAAAFEGADLTDPQKTLTDGLTAFLRAVAASPEVYRLIFLQEGGGNAAIARRIRRARDAQVDALAQLAAVWLTSEHASRSGNFARAIDRKATLLGNALVGLAEAGARLVLASPEEFSPDEVGAELGRLATASALAA